MFLALDGAHFRIGYFECYSQNIEALMMAHPQELQQSDNFYCYGKALCQSFL